VEQALHLRVWPHVRRGEMFRHHQASFAFSRYGSPRDVRRSRLIEPGYTTFSGPLFAILFVGEVGSFPYCVQYTMYIQAERLVLVY
jgi:hypothetical protein